MARCCGGASCSCLIQTSGAQVSITGSGQASDPYIIHGGVDLQVVDTSVFNLTLTGAGTTAAPWLLSAAFAASAKLDDLPDVNAATPTNGQVLGWDTATSRWTARAPTTAASGSVQHDTALTGDGSAGTPLGVNEDVNGYLATAAAGLGLSDIGKNRIIRHYASASIRAAASPTPDLNTLTMLDTVPGRIDFWNGTAWVEYRSYTLDVVGQMLAISGAYAGAGKLTFVVRQVAALTDGFGYFDVLSAADLSGKAGVLGCWFQPLLSSVFTAVLETTTTTVRGRAYNVADGSPYLNQSVAGVVFAIVY
jgi:hypothetical protein